MLSVRALPEPGKPCLEVLPATKSSRHNGIRFVATDEGCGVITIDTARARVDYIVSTFPVDFDGRGFHFQKAPGETGTDRESESYDVFVGKPHGLCGCKGFFYANHCKHIAAAEALVANGWL